MAFRTNTGQQLTFDDSFGNLTPREQKAIRKSWAHDFATIVFPAINEERFAVLYSDNKASRPNTPVNVTVGALMLKEYSQLSDDELFDSILFDVRYQYALHTTSFEEQPFSDRTLSRFRERLYEYERTTGIDLLKLEMEHLAEVYADKMNLKKNVKRMDSLMVASRCKVMSRLEIIYTCVADMVRLLHRLGMSEYISSDMEHYLDAEDRNKVIYHAKGDECEDRLGQVIKDAAALRDALTGDSWLDFTEYQLLIRVLDEQTRFDDDGNVAAKDKTEVTADSLQNPSDPDATYRSKAGKSHKGYVGNIVETVDENGNSVISSFQYEPNNYSDSEFMSDYLESQPEHAADDNETVIVDGAYASYENSKLAEEKNITLVPTALSGKDPDEIYADFELSDDETKVVKCPMGYEPVKQTQYKTGMIRAQFRKDQCENCPHRDRCKGKPQRKTYAVYVSAKIVYRAKQLCRMSTDDYKILSRKRNAVEGVMSVLRRKHRVDEIPVTGHIRSKMFFTCKIGAYNLGKLFRYCQSTRGSCAPIQAFA